jgi:NitT/TauT family transport system substrate-binding protein
MARGQAHRRTPRPRIAPPADAGGGAVRASSATDPARAARQLVDGGFTSRYDYALQSLNELPYDRWREYDAEDTIRFYALRLRDVGLIKSTPQKIIAEGTDWRFLNELKRELKA